MRILALIFVLCSFAASAQRPFSRDFWLNETQAAVNVNAMAEAPSGYIWVGTNEGLYRFNGRDFTFIGDSIGRPVTAVACHGNDIYIGYEDGTLARVIKDKIHPLKSINKGPRTMIRDIEVEASGIAWLCTEEGVFLYNNGFYSNFNATGGLADDFTYELVKHGQSIFVGTDNGISELRYNGRNIVVKRFGTQEGLTDNIINTVKKVSASAGPVLWLGTHEGGAMAVSIGQGVQKRTVYPGPWQWGQVTDIAPVSDREAWAITESGYLLHLMAKDTSTLTVDMEVRPYFFAGKKFRKLFRIRSGNVWCATNEGLTVVTTAHAAYTIVDAPYFFSTLTAITCEGSRNLWLGQERELLSMPLGADSATPVHQATLPANITCMYTHGGSAGIWIGTFGKGLWYFSHQGRLEEMNTAEGLKKGNILSITTFNSRLWVASLNGVDELDVSNSQLVLKKHHNKASGIGSDYVYQMYNDRKGRLWFATDGAGVAMYDGKKFRRWDSSSGLTAKVVYSVSVDAQGNVWAGTPDQGVFRYDGKSWKQMTTENGLQDMSVSSVITNKTGQVLVVTQKGIDEWFPNSNLFRRFNKKTNLDIQSISTTLNCVARDASGNVYIPFDKGFAVFTNVPVMVDLKPGISINEVSVFFKPLTDDDAEFNYDENQLTFHFEGINYSNIERLHYRYQLEGYHDDWIYTNDEEVTLSQLPTGRFKFRIQASLDKDFEEANEASYGFEINSPFWKSPWFLALAAAALFGILYLYIKLRERDLKKVNRLQSERMRFEYEHLKSQVNPHFLFNSLNTLSALIEEDKDRAVDYTSQLSDLYRSMLAHKDMDLIDLEDELEIIDNYMYIQRSRFGDALRMEVNIPELVVKGKKIIPLALQILVENAIKHNVVSRFKPLVIYIEANDEKITVKNALNPKITKEKGEGLGLSNIQRRYSLLTKKHIHYGISNNQFVVSLPLL